MGWGLVSAVPGVGRGQATIADHPCPGVTARGSVLATCSCPLAQCCESCCQHGCLACSWGGSLCPWDAQAGSPVKQRVGFCRGMRSVLPARPLPAWTQGAFCAPPCHGGLGSLSPWRSAALLCRSLAPQPAVPPLHPAGDEHLWLPALLEHPVLQPGDQLGEEAAGLQSGYVTARPTGAASPLSPQPSGSAWAPAPPVAPGAGGAPL